MGIVNPYIPFPTWHLRSGKWDLNENSRIFKISFPVVIRQYSIACNFPCCFLSSLLLRFSLCNLFNWSQVFYLNHKTFEFDSYVLSEVSHFWTHLLLQESGKVTQVIIKCVSKVLGQLSDSRTLYIASVTISASANNFLN